MFGCLWEAWEFESMKKMPFIVVRALDLYYEYIECTCMRALSGEWINRWAGLGLGRGMCVVLLQALTSDGHQCTVHIPPVLPLSFLHILTLNIFLWKNPLRRYRPLPLHMLKISRPDHLYNLPSSRFPSSPASFASLLTFVLVALVAYDLQSLSLFPLPPIIPLSFSDSDTSLISKVAWVKWEAQGGHMMNRTY